MAAAVNVDFPLTAHTLRNPVLQPFNILTPSNSTSSSFSSTLGVIPLAIVKCGTDQA